MAAPRERNGWPRPPPKSSSRPGAAQAPSTGTAAWRSKEVLLTRGVQRPGTALGRCGATSSDASTKGQGTHTAEASRGASSHAPVPKSASSAGNPMLRKVSTEAISSKEIPRDAVRCHQVYHKMPVFTMVEVALDRHLLVDPFSTTDANGLPSRAMASWTMPFMRRHWSKAFLSSHYMLSPACTLITLFEFYRA